MSDTVPSESPKRRGNLANLTGGSRKGIPNKTTATIKQAFAEAFEKRGGAAALIKWAEANETEFYKLASKLIPSEVQAELTGSGGQPLVINIKRFDE